MITGTLANGFALCEFLSFFPVNVYWLAFVLTLLIGNTAILTPLFCIQIYWVNPLTPSLTLFATNIAIFSNLVKIARISTSICSINIPQNSENDRETKTENDREIKKDPENLRVL